MGSISYMGYKVTTTGGAQPFKGLRASDFMHQMAVDEDQAGGIVAGRHDMRVPDLLVERAGLFHMLG